MGFPKLRFVASGLAFSCIMALLGGCSEDAPAEEEPTEYVLRASTASMTELGVAGWRIDFPDGAYQVTGLDADGKAVVAMRLVQRPAEGGVSETNVTLASAAGSFDKSFTMSDDTVVDFRDAIASDARAARALELMGLDLAKPQVGDSVAAASVRPLNGPTLTEPPSGKGLTFGNDASKKGCGEGNLTRPSCTKIIDQTNLDCLTTAQCQQAGKTTACGGSDAQCRKDQAYVRTLGCDIKCAPSPPTQTI